MSDAAAARRAGGRGGRARRALRAAAAGLPLAAGAAYPFAVHLGLRHLDVRALALGVGALLAVRGAWLLRRAEPAERRRLLVPLAAVAAPIAAALGSRDARALLLLPALVSGALALVFARSLVRGRPIIETIARLQAGPLPPDEVRYTRTLTRIWCGFFVANAAVAGALALAGPLALWTLYTGALAYLAIGLLLAGEQVYRAWRFRRYTGSLGDPLLRRIFPPRAERGAGSRLEGAGAHAGEGSSGGSRPAR